MALRSSCISRSRNSTRLALSESIECSWMPSTWRPIGATSASRPNNPASSRATGAVVAAAMRPTAPTTVPIGEFVWSPRINVIAKTMARIT